ncbi:MULTISPECIES: hypothetical protein [unclassified Acidovorax]|uniref:hypothetical protein n=1 Tax=unclassified Acidovorax TaxID=2684926 RepID=UPI002104F85A|nr:MULTISPECIES: hypothetical protein [unclassified Acidovorax]
MNRLIRSLCLCLALAAPWARAAVADPSLLGCWRAAKIVLTTPDGEKAEDTSGRCTLQFKEDQFESTCKTASGTATTTYRYQVVRPQVYAATMAGSTFRTEMVGSTREYEYHITGDQLRTVTVPPAMAFAAAAAAQRVETEAARAPCP